MNRFRFVLFRPIQLIPVLIGISVVSFFLLHAVPGDPVRALLGARANAENVASIKARYGLDRPALEQYVHYLRRLAKGDLGESIVYKTEVSRLLGRRASATLFLLAYAVVLTAFLTFPLAIAAATWRGRWPDHLIRALSTVGLGLPAFWLGINLIIVFSVWAKLFPVSGFGDNFAAHMHHLFLPALTIALALSALLIRTMRASLLESLDADFVTAARAKGLPNRWILHRHVLRNSLIPTTNLFGVNIGWLIGGTVVIESVFSIPGLGQLLVQSVLARDYFVVQALTLIFAVGTVLASLLVDVITVALDPRIRL